VEGNSCEYFKTKYLEVIGFGMISFTLLLLTSCNNWEFLVLLRKIELLTSSLLMKVGEVLEILLLEKSRLHQCCLFTSFIIEFKFELIENQNTFQVEETLLIKIEAELEKVLFISLAELSTILSPLLNKEFVKNGFLDVDSILLLM